MLHWSSFFPLSRRGKSPTAASPLSPARLAAVRRRIRAGRLVGGAAREMPGPESRLAALGVTQQRPARKVIAPRDVSAGFANVGRRQFTVRVTGREPVVDLGNLVVAAAVIVQGNVLRYLEPDRTAWDATVGVVTEPLRETPSPPIAPNPWRETTHSKNARRSLKSAPHGTLARNTSEILT